MDSKLHNEIGKTVEYAEKHGGDLTSKNLKYVWAAAENVSRNTGVDAYDLFVEGVIAMKKCEERYDPELNDNFTKFCSASVRGYMLNVVNRQQGMVHVPVNHMKGFKKGQEQREEVSEITYDRIDAYDYDFLGLVENDFMTKDRGLILEEGLNKLDESGRTALMMKLKMGKYRNLKNVSMKMIADELEVPTVHASKIYKEAFDKLSRYCQMEAGM